MGKEVYERMYDVIVAGAGVSGCAAAVSAGRAGASVLVIEKNGYPGGTLTGCGVGPMMTFHAGDKQIICGFMQETVDRLMEKGYSPGHVPDTKQYTDTITPFRAEGLKTVLDEMLVESGCKVLLHTFVGAVEREGEKIKGLTLCNKDGLNKAWAKVFIDATGDGDVAAWAGLPMTNGRPEDGASQPMTMKMKYCNVSTQKLKEHVLTHLDEFPKLKPHEKLFKEDIPIDLEGFDGEVAQAKARGELSMARENILMFATDREGEYIINTTRVIGYDATDASGLSEAEMAGRRQCAELDRFLRKYVPGFENALLEFTGPSIGVRSSRQLRGVYTLTAGDILSCKPFDSAVAHSGYPIDIHNPSGEGAEAIFLTERGDYYSIPFEIMVCPEASNLIVTGRCVSATFEAQAAIRVTPSAGALGQAAGTAAFLAARKDGDVRKTELAALREALLRQGAYLDLARA
ncbi:MAG: FAD-dependent oxidoreductase [Clostridiales bacterium]|jgi:hypothetical protein|nr:FAD-dependent oxidoreductase [Clostridiales bacterium]